VTTLFDPVRISALELPNRSFLSDLQPSAAGAAE